MTRYRIAVCGVVMLLSVYAGAVLAAEGDLTLSVPVLNSKLVIQTRARYGGAISSLVFRGKEYLDAHDHGRLLQSASSFDGYGECFNPTEAGSARDFQKRSTSSVLKAARIKGDSIETSAEMAFWLTPGDGYPRGCGSRKNITHAVNTTITSKHVLDKRVTVGLPNFPNVINYQVTYHVPKAYSRGQFEASTGYMPKEFSEIYYYDPLTAKLIHAGNRQGEQAHPVIIATPGGRSAMGVYSPWLPQNGGGYGAFSFPTVNKWNCVFRVKNVRPKAYSFQCLIVVGTLKEVETTITRLNSRYHHVVIRAGRQGIRRPRVDRALGDPSRHGN